MGWGESLVFTVDDLGPLHGGLRAADLREVGFGSALIFLRLLQSGQRRRHFALRHRNAQTPGFGLCLQ